MAVQTVDAKGLESPQPTVKITVLKTEVRPGEVSESVADRPAFDQDVKEWCTRAKMVVLWMRYEGDVKRCQIQCEGPRRASLGNGSCMNTNHEC